MTTELVRRLRLDGTSTAKEAANYLEAIGVVKPLDFANTLKHAFLSGVVAARNIPGCDPCDGAALWTQYEPYVPGSYTRIAAALGIVIEAPVQDCTTCYNRGGSYQEAPCYHCFWEGKYTSWEAYK